MRYRQLSPTGDYTFGAGLRNYYIDVPAAPGQAVKTRLQLAQGEWFLDLSEGTPYASNVFGKQSQANADVVVRDRTLSTQGIVSISSYESSLEPVTRAFRAAETVTTIYGETEVEIEGRPFPIPPVLGNELITQSGYVLTTQSGKAITKQ